MKKNVLLHCTLYSELRSEIFDNLFSNNSFVNKTSEKHIRILLNDNIRKTTKFIVKAI
jgi:hypothetical protein